jgi:hypothetical protein
MLHVDASWTFGGEVVPLSPTTSKEVPLTSALYCADVDLNGSIDADRNRRELTNHIHC